MEIFKYDIVNVNLNPRKWHIQAWIRPCIVIQSNIFNKYSPTLIVVPLTKVNKELFPSEFWIDKSDENWLTYKSRFLWSQIITVDKKFVIEKLWKLDFIYYNKLNESINISLDLDNLY